MMLVLRTRLFALGAALRRSWSSRRNDEQARKRQQYGAVGKRCIRLPDGARVALEIRVALGIVERIEERPQAATLEPFDDALRAARKTMVVRRDPDVDAAAMRLQQLVIPACTAARRPLAGDACKLARPRAVGRHLAHQHV